LAAITHTQDIDVAAPVLPLSFTFP